MVTQERDFLLFSGSSHPSLAEEIASCLKVSLSQAQINRFPDGEISLQLQQTVRGHDVFVVQSTALDPNNYLMELLLLIDALKRASAKTIAAVIPYFGYCRQDRKDRPRVPISAKVVADLLTSVGATRIVTMDLHTEQVQGFFDIPVDNLYARPYLAETVRKELKDFIVVTPDIGSIKMAHGYARQLKVDFAIVEKHRRDPREVEMVRLIGEVEGKDVLLTDDICSTGETIVSAANLCKERGAKRIFAVVTHGLFVERAMDRIEKSHIEKLFVSNTVFWDREGARSTKLQKISVAPLFAEAINSILARKSISSLSQFEM